MTRDDIIRMAREAGLEVFVFDGVEEIGVGDGYHIQTDLIERFAALVAALQQEPETCAVKDRSPSRPNVRWRCPKNGQPLA